MKWLSSASERRRMVQSDGRGQDVRDEVVVAGKCNFALARIGQHVYLVLRDYHVYIYSTVNPLRSNSAPFASISINVVIQD